MKAFHLSAIHCAAAAPAAFTLSQFITSSAITATTARITAMTGRKARFTEPCAIATTVATALYAVMAAFNVMITAATAAMTPISGTSHEVFCCTQVANSASFAATCVRIGNNASPRVALVFSNAAAMRCCWPCRVSDSRAKLPVALPLCAVIAASVACILALRSPDLYRSPKPIEAAWAFNVASLREMPYFSIGSISPLSAALSASTASAVVPPNMEDKSAPRVISSLVLSADSSTLMPKF